MGVELIFEVRDEEEGGCFAHALGQAIFTEAEAWDELCANVLEATSLHFEDEAVHPRRVQLHYVKDEMSPAEAARSCRGGAAHGAILVFMNRYRIPALLVTGLLCVSAWIAWGDAQANPWSASELLAPKALADELRGGAAKPVVIAVVFPAMYRQRHIAGALFAGPGRDASGIDALKAAVKGLPADTAIVLYCGCCPMVRCPNIRPAYRTLKELGYTNVRVLDLETNFHDDWSSNGYPSEPPI